MTSRWAWIGEGIQLRPERVRLIIQHFLSTLPQFYMNLRDIQITGSRRETREIEHNADFDLIHVAFQRLNL
jgi:hypothetical protein